MLNYRLINKLIIITVTVIIMHTSSCNAGCASDGGGEIPPPKIPDTSAGIMKKIMKPAETTPIKPDVKIEAQEKTSIKTETEKKEAKKAEKKLSPDKKEPSAEHAAGQSFLSLFLNMLGVLAKTLLFILLTAGAFLLYKALRKGTPANQKQKEDKINQPSNISEAVSSYISHKIKKNAY